MYLNPILNFNNGYIQVNLISTNSEDTVTGRFIICRSSSLDNFSTWIPLYKFDLVDQIPTNKKLFCDFAIE
jgi:hypothetical protein